MAHRDYSHLKEQFTDIINYCKSLQVGDKIKFQSEKQRYTIKAKSDRYIICTKPFNPKKTVLYTIVDLERLVRGANNLVFNCYNYELQEDIDGCLNDLESNPLYEVSHRNCIMLDVEVI